MAEGTHRLTFEDHRRSLEAFGIVYPVLSRRSRGVSIGVNLNLDKACNFDCIYCQVDRTGDRTGDMTAVDTGAVSLERLRQELSALLGWVKDGTLFVSPPFDSVPPNLRRVNDICFAGDGEPTSAPEFLDAVQVAASLRASFGLDALKLVLITNATLLQRPAVEAALAVMDGANGEIWAKLDAGTEAWYRRISGSHVPFSRILENLRACGRKRPLVLQTLFLDVEAGGMPEEEVEAYIQRVKWLLEEGAMLRSIQLYTVARRTPQPGVYALSNPALDALVAQLRLALPLPVEPFYGSASYMRPEPALAV